MNSSPSFAPLADAVERVAPSVVAVRSRHIGTSTAFTWRPGVLVTAATAIGRAQRVQVVLASGEAVAGEVRGQDAATDIAVIGLDAEVPPVERRLDPPLRVGDVVFAAGREPGALLHASFGHVGAVGPAWRTWRGGAVDRLVRLDGGLHPGLMGAPVADAHGQVIGLASAALARHHGIVLPAVTVDRIAETLLAHGRVQRGHLGVAVQEVALTPAMRDAGGLDSASGLLLTGVGDDSPAARGGLLVGDLLLSAGGRPVPSLEALRDVLGEQQAGATLRIVLLRGGRREELALQVGEQPSPCRC